ncbi:MAG TPA: VOC family protein [Solirubrobacteraceae bacterium]|nr:VOC family protein [Solirubrobacteraceae bacterium]
MTPGDAVSPAEPRLDPGARIGTVALTVADLSRAQDFYQRVLGMAVLDDSGVELVLGAGATPLLTLRGDPGAAPRDRRQTGLFHFAVRVPGQTDLARALVGLARARWPLSGASDHLVSEALYLDDPDGNGIEIYRDRPREQWGETAAGEVEMSTLPLDLDRLLSSLGDDLPDLAALPAGTDMGHVHLQVADLAAVEPFYTAVLGFDVRARSYPGALFVAAGGYHHHVGLNVWNSRGGTAPGPGAVGLRWFELHAGAGLDGVLERVETAGLTMEPQDGGMLVRDSSANAVLLRA